MSTFLPKECTRVGLKFLSAMKSQSSNRTLNLIGHSHPNDYQVIIWK
jgi:hypothetical protein